MKALYALVGMKHRGSEAVVAALKNGHLVLLVREPDNPHDPGAVQVWIDHGPDMLHVGYIKATQARDLARRLDAPIWHQRSRNTGRPCVTGVLRVTGERWPMVEVEE